MNVRMPVLRWRRRARVLLAGCAAAFVAATPPLAGAYASPDAATPGPPAAPPSGRIFLVAQNPWTVNGQDLVLHLRVDDSDPADSLEVAVTLCAKVNTRSEFALTLQPRAPCNPISVVNPRLSDLPVGADGSVELTMPVKDKVATPGVYPARVELRQRKGSEIDHFVTHVISVPATPDAKLSVGLILPVDGGVNVSKTGAPQLASGAADAVATVTTAVADHPSVPLTLVPTPAVLQQLAASTRSQDPATVDALAQQANGLRQIIAGPFVPISLPALNAGGLGSEEAAQTVRGAEALEETLKTRPDPRTWVAFDRLDSASVAALTDRGVDRLVLPDASLQPITLSRTLTQPFTVEGRPGRRIAAASADAGLLAHFDTADQPALAAQQLLADLTVVWFDAPNVKNRAVVAMPPSDWQPDGTFLQTALDGLAASPVLAATTLDTLFTAIPPATAPRDRGPLVRALAPLPTDAVSALPVTTLRTARRKLDAFGSIVDRDTPQATELYDDLERSLLVAESSSLHPKERLSATEAVEKRIDRQLALVHMPAARSVTLTARQGEIPVTVLSDAPFPVHVTIQLQSDKLRFPNGDQVELPPLSRRVTTLRVTVQARTSGSFPLRVTVRTPSGAVLSQSRITVRSTATSGVGVVLSVGAGAFLFLWWLRHARHGRRARRLVPA